MGPYAGVDYNSPSLIVNSGSQLSYWVENICICLLSSKTTNMKRESTEKGEGRGKS